MSVAFSDWARRDQDGGRRSFDRQDEWKRFIPRVEADRPVDPGRYFGHRNGDCWHLEAKSKMQVLVALSRNRKEPPGLFIAIYYIPNRAGCPTHSRTLRMSGVGTTQPSRSSSRPQSAARVYFAGTDVLGAGAPRSNPSALRSSSMSGQ
jgi:hypothetical protein